MQTCSFHPSDTFSFTSVVTNILCSLRLHHHPQTKADVWLWAPPTCQPKYSSFGWQMAGMNVKATSRHRDTGVPPKSGNNETPRYLFHWSRAECSDLRVYQRENNLSYTHLRSRKSFWEEGQRVGGSLLQKPSRGFLFQIPAIQMDGSFSVFGPAEAPQPMKIHQCSHQI